MVLGFPRHERKSSQVGLVRFIRVRVEKVLTQTTVIMFCSVHASTRARERERERERERDIREVCENFCVPCVVC